jgi:hypothetical protein
MLKQMIIVLISIKQLPLLGECFLRFSNIYFHRNDIDILYERSKIYGSGCESTDGIIGLIKPTNAKTNDNSINIHKTTSIT